MAESSRRAVTQDDSLPPVEPPSPAFLVPLFVVPAVIVGCLLAVFGAIKWIAQPRHDPSGYVRALQRQTEGRWQAAFNLANDLRGPRGAELKDNADLAASLAGILDAEVHSGRPAAGGAAGEQSLALCDYLCRALGEFAVPQAAPPLVALAADDAQPRIARSAVEALAVLATNLQNAGRGFGDGAAATAAVLAASRCDDTGLRSSAAFALGVIGGDGVVERLEALEGDAADDVRYNAATSLARLGRSEAYGTLSEMLALPDVVVPPGDEAVRSAAAAARYRRVLVVVNALTAVGKLVDAAQDRPPEQVLTRIAALADDPIGDVREAAVAVRDKCHRVAPAARP